MNADEERIIQAVGPEWRTTFEVFHTLHPDIVLSAGTEYRRMHRRMSQMAKYGILERRKVGPIYGHYTSEWRVAPCAL